MDSGQSLIAYLNLSELLQHASLLKRFVTVTLFGNIDSILVQKK